MDKSNNPLQPNRPVVALLADALEAGRWRGGDRLPPERALAEELGVGRASVRTALAELERRGRIWRHVGRGTFVCDDHADGAGTAFAAPEAAPSDAFELRMMIEPAVAAAAALRATSATAGALKRCAGEGAAAEGWQAWEAADTAFHTALARATRNPLLEGVLAMLNDMRRRREWGDMREATLNPGRQRLYTAHHHAIVDAVADHDAARAAAAMRDHIAAVQAAMVGDPADLALAAVRPWTE